MSLRTRLSLSIAALVLVAVAALGIAVHNLGGSRLDDRADSDLAVQADGLARAIAAAPPGSEAEAARSYIAGQALAGSRLLIAQVPGAPGPISNQSTLLLDRSGEDGHEGAEEHEEEEEHAQLRDLLEADPGYTTIELAETGDLRLLTREIDTPAGAATLQAGEPAAATEEAQHQVAKTFLLIGSLTVLAAAGLGAEQVLELGVLLRFLAVLLASLATALVAVVEQQRRLVADRARGAGDLRYQQPRAGERLPGDV